MKTICVIEKCGSPMLAKGMCHKHYNADWYIKHRVTELASGAARRRSNKHGERERLKEWRKNNQEKYKAQQRKHYEENRDKIKAYRAAHSDEAKRYMSAYYKKNTAMFKAKAAVYKSAHPELRNADNGARRASQVNATPLWANEFFIKEIYHLAALRTKVTGFKWHVDHIVPLRSKIVCGLHVENNLQVIPEAENLKKSNRHWPDMPT